MLGPMRLKPVVKEIVWGGRWLAEELGRTGADSAALGESWEAYSGSVVQDGKHSGKTLGELFAEHGIDVFGTLSSRFPRFPLLVKFIDARQNLSIQVHPDDQLAEELEGYPYGKTEFWYVLEAAPGAELIYGLAEGCASEKQVRDAIAGQGADSTWRRVPVKCGDVVSIPAGTVHALTAGVVVYELQQDCDITYRLYDWGRTDREIHVEKGIRSINFTSEAGEVTQPKMEAMDGYSVGELEASQYFRALLYNVGGSVTLPARDDSFTLLTLIDGQCKLESLESQLLQKGDTIFVPAHTDVTITAQGNACSFISGTLA